MKILLATDGSKYSKTAIVEIANRPILPNTKIHIVSAYKRSNLIVPVGHELINYDTEAIDKSILKNAKSAVEDAVKILRKKHPTISITTTTIEGSPKNVILKEAEKFGADLIVVGSHGYGAIEGFLLGSVSHAIALHAKCSIEIIRK